MTWKRANETGMDGRRHGGGAFQNRECRNCTHSSCQKGEKLHLKRLDYRCCKSFCDCPGFEPDTGPVLTEVLNRNVSGRRRRSRRFLDQGTVES